MEISPFVCSRCENSSHFYIKSSTGNTSPWALLSFIWVRFHAAFTTFQYIISKSYLYSFFFTIKYKCIFALIVLNCPPDRVQCWWVSPLIEAVAVRWREADQWTLWIHHNLHHSKMTHFEDFIIHCSFVSVVHEGIFCLSRFYEHYISFFSSINRIVLIQWWLLPSNNTTNSEDII